MKIVAVIPAKSNSKRFPNKNIYEFRGKPMLAWAIEACKKSKYDIEVWVSSDGKGVLDIAYKYGAIPYERNEHLCGDDVFKQDVIMDVAYYIEYMCKNENKSCPDIIISLQPNSPQIKSKYLDDAIDKLIKYDQSEIFSVNGNLIQNSAFRIMKWNYVFQKRLSTYCGVIVCDLIDVHTKEDLEKIENIEGENNENNGRLV